MNLGVSKKIDGEEKMITMVTKVKLPNAVFRVLESKSL
jgi:hypothetical protein